jgi:hypothetical protein
VTNGCIHIFDFLAEAFLMLLDLEETFLEGEAADFLADAVADFLTALALLAAVLFLPLAFFEAFLAVLAAFLGLLAFFFEF